MAVSISRRRPAGEADAREPPTSDGGAGWADGGRQETVRERERGEGRQGKRTEKEEQTGLVID